MGTIIIRCRNCHNPFNPVETPGHRGDFCSWACENEYNDRKTKERLQTTAMLNASISLRRQQEEQERREQQAEAARQAAIKAQQEAEFAEKAKAVGFESSNMAKIWSKNGQLSLEDAYKRKQECEEKRANVDENWKNLQEALSKMMTSDQKNIQDTIKQVSESRRIPFWIVYILFTIFGFVLGIGSPLSVWKTTAYFLGFGLIIALPLVIKYYKAVLIKIKNVKGNDCWPFYNIKIYEPFDNLYFYLSGALIGIAIIIATTLFLFQIMWLGIVGLIVTVLSTILILDTFLDKFNADKYFIKQIKKEIGSFSPVFFDSIGVQDSNPLYWWAVDKDHENLFLGSGIYAFLPDYDDENFTSKYGSFSKYGLNSIDSIEKDRKKEK